MAFGSLDTGEDDGYNGAGFVEMSESIAPHGASVFGTRPIDIDYHSG